MRSLEISGRLVSDATDAYVIAEIGHNHGGRLDTAEELVRAAAAAGADAVKLQKRDNRRLYTRAMYNQPYTGRNSFGATYGEHREALELGRSDYLQLMSVAAECGVHLMSTAFDLPSVDFLCEIGVPAIKIASGDVTNTPLLSYAAKSGLPLIVSTGGASMDEVTAACDVLLSITPKLALLQCTAVYPANPSDLNLSVITTYRGVFPETVIGFSGHDLGAELSMVAYALGARVVEKHLTLDRGARGSDHHFSLDCGQFAELTRGLRRSRQALGSPVKRMLAQEASAVKKLGKKLVASRDMQAGHVLAERDIVCKSPGDGLKPYRLGDVIGRRLLVPLREDEDIRLDALAPDAVASPHGAARDDDRATLRQAVRRLAT
jgi:sialic acid synthase